MNYRALGKTGLEVSEIGYGAWGIGKTQWLGAEDEESLKALNRAIDLGLNFIDTALAYGNGHSERLVGQVVGEREETVIEEPTGRRAVASDPQTDREQQRLGRRPAAGWRVGSLAG